MITSMRYRRNVSLVYQKKKINVSLSLHKPH